MSKYVLITYYNRGTMQRPIWEVYGHEREHVNKHLGSFKTETGARLRAFQYHAPVMRGPANNPEVAAVLRKLSPQTAERSSRSSRARVCHQEELVGSREQFKRGKGQF